MAVSGFTNAFSSSFDDNELYFLSCRVPAKPGTAKDLIEADDIDCEVKKKLSNLQNVISQMRA